jgi:hypothetical protein
MSAPIGDAKSGGDIGTLPPPQEQKTGRAKDQSQSGEAAKAADYDVDKMVRWLVQSKKYRLGVNPKYNEIFWKYIELNNRRLKEIRELESAPPPSQIRWTIDPATLTPVPYEPGASAPPAVAPIPHEPGASSPRDTTLHDDGRQTLQDDPPTIIQDVRGLVDVRVSNAENQQSCRTPFRFDRRQKFPASQRFHWLLRKGIERMQNQRLTVGDFLRLVRYYARGVFDPTTADRIANTMAELSTNDPNVVSSERLRDDYRLNTADLLGALR